MTRAEIIAHLESEINLLLRVREILATPLADFLKVAPRKIKAKVPAKPRKQPEAALAAVAVAAPAPIVEKEVELEPQVRRVPPKRRMERRQAPTEKPGRSAAALSGLVPSGPVAVSATEARKMQERAAPPPAMPATELRHESSNERSLGSLIQAFERRAGLNGLEIP